MVNISGRTYMLYGCMDINDGHVCYNFITECVYVNKCLLISRI